MRYFLILLLTTSSYAAETKEDIRLAMEFERMKFRSDYPNDLDKASKAGQLFILWVDNYDPKVFAWCKANHPDAIHSFIESSKLESCSPGIVVGVRGTMSVEQVKTFSMGSTEGVILTIKGLSQKQPPNNLLLSYPHHSGYLEASNSRFR